MSQIITIMVLLCCFFSTIASQIRLGLLQIPLNLAVNDMEHWIKTASLNKTDIVILPSKYFTSLQCSNHNDGIINDVIGWCIKYNLAILISCDLSNASNALLIDENGVILMNYTQSSHNGNDPNLTSITLITSFSKKEIVVSIILDDDIYYPELARSVMLQNTELLLFPTNGILNNNTDDIVLYTRSYENVMGIARVNAARSNNTNNNNNGRSAIACKGGRDTNSINEMFIVPPSDDKERLILHLFDLEYLREARKHVPDGDAFRRPFRYQQLCGLQPFNTTLIPPSNNKDIIVTVAALQIIPGQSVDDNIQIATKYITEAKTIGNADIVFMSEMWNIGYLQLFPGYTYGNMTNLNDVYQWMSMGDKKYSSTYYEYFQSLSKNLSISIGIAYLEDVGMDNMIPPKNSITIFDKNGNELYSYSKVHTCNWLQNEALTTPGHEFYVKPLDLGDNRGKINLGAMICYDQEFPESARILSQLGAELIIKPNASKMDLASHWRLRSKSIENIVGIMMSNYPLSTIGDMNGNSCAYDYDGSVISIANQTEQILYANFDINSIRTARINNIKRINSHKIIRLCDFQRNPAFKDEDVYHRVSGSTI